MGLATKITESVPGVAISLVRTRLTHKLQQLEAKLDPADLRH